MYNKLYKISFFLFVFLFSTLGTSTTFAANRTVDLTVDYKTVHFAGKPVKAFAINNQIPAPTLHFKQGDNVTINVHNHLKEGTTIHWHGLLVPWRMDGVEGVTQLAIPPGGVFHYQFTLKQSGTYWYHAHSGFQEQQGLYGALIIDPPHPPSYHYTKDYVVVLSDWINTPGKQVFANLKKEGDYYSSKFPIQASLTRFMRDYHKGNAAQRQRLKSDYKMMQQMRMSIYDFSDVAYDAFLLNGQTAEHPWTAAVKVGDTVRLRFIGAPASTNFRVKIADASMQLVHVQGNDVEPQSIQDFTIMPGETYDVVVKIKKNNPYIIYAESADTLGAAYGVLLTDSNQTVDYKKVKPFPMPEAVMMGHHMMPGMKMSGMMNHSGHQMDMSNMKMSDDSGHQMDMSNMKMGDHSGHHMMGMMSHDHGASGNVSLTSGTKYQELKSPNKTNDPNKSVTEIKMELSGYMGRYAWFINGLPESKADLIRIEHGKRYRIIFTNNSMMHHPMHIHGHWFILRNGHGDHDPLLHTIDVPPGATAVADFDANTKGQWFFHCHHLYHMMSGMSRIFRYTTFASDEMGITADVHSPTEKEKIIKAEKNKQKSNLPEFLSEHPVGHSSHLHFAGFIDIAADLSHHVQEGNLKFLLGSDDDKLQLFSKDAEINKGTVENADVDIFYWHLLDEFWAVKGGVNYFYRPSHTPYWQPGVGLEGLMPYFIDTDLRMYYHDGSVKLDVEFARDTQITNNFFIETGVRSIFATKTIMRDEIGSGLNEMEYIVKPYYRLTPNVSVFTEFKHTSEYGALRKIHRSLGESVSENMVLFGVELVV